MEAREKERGKREGGGRRRKKGRGGKEGSFSGKKDGAMLAWRWWHSGGCWVTKVKTFIK